MRSDFEAHLYEVRPRKAIVERSAILDTSKFVRIAVDWLLRSDIGEVLKTIVDDEAFPGVTRVPGRSNSSAKSLFES